MIPDC